MEKPQDMTPAQAKEAYEGLLRFKANYDVFHRVISKHDNLLHDSRIEGLNMLLTDDSIFYDVVTVLHPDIEEFRKKMEMYEDINDAVNRRLSAPAVGRVMNGTSRILKYENNLDLLHPDIKKYMAEKFVLDAYGAVFPIRNFSLEQMEHLKSRMDSIVDLVADKMKFSEKCDTINKMILQQYKLGSSLGEGITPVIIDCVSDPAGAFLYIRQASMFMALAESTVFSNVSTNLGAYYPKTELQLENLESLLQPGYILDDDHGNKFKVVKLKNGDNKEERSKIKSKVMVKDGDVSLKYMAFGIYGEKVDVVLNFTEDTSKDNFGLHHLDYGGVEFKTYNDGQRKMFLGVDEASEDHTEHTLKWLLDKSPHVKNHFLIRDGDSVRLNTTGIGGEALTYTCDFIENNYSDIINASKK